MSFFPLLLDCALGILQITSLKISTVVSVVTVFIYSQRNLA